MFYLRRLFAAGTVVLLASALAPIGPVTSRAGAQESATITISEFLADNDTGLSDTTGDREDWVELHNRGNVAVDLAGWTLADDSETFVFPTASIPSGGYLIVFASGHPERATAGELHLPFKLSAGGEALELRTPVGVLTAPSWNADTGYPAQSPDRSYGLAPDGSSGFFSAPTPGSPNGAADSIVAPVEFSVDHGFFETSQDVVLKTATAGASIRYTRDGTTPTEVIGELFTPGSTLAIDRTSTIRAVAYMANAITSPVETRTYLFAADIVLQSDDPEGWPVDRSLNDQRLDYGMNPSVVQNADVVGALRELPTISIVTDGPNLFDEADGIYVNATNRGRSWERPASIELIDPTGSEPGFAIEAGLRMRGGSSRGPDNPKHSFRLFFRNQYESALDYPIFGGEGADRFEKLDLRTSQNYSWHWKRTPEASFIDEVWSRDTQAAMGAPATRSRQYHLYLNGQYWGIYMTQERPSGEFGESYFGGDEADYDVVKRGAPGSSADAASGEADAWLSLFDLVSDLDISTAEFETLRDQVDLVNLADYYLLHFFSGDFDSSPSYFFDTEWSESNNWYAIRNRSGVGGAAKWLFLDHDSEHSLCANNGPRSGASIDNTTPWNLDPSLGADHMAPAWLHAALLSHDTYRQIFADRVQMHMRNPGGALTSDQALMRLDVRAAEVERAIVAESARWGDGDIRSALDGSVSESEPNSYGRVEWSRAVQSLRECIASRHAIVEQQLRADGLWPSGESPTIAPGAGPVPFGTRIIIDDVGQQGTTWFTTDGSDPRGADGSIATTATEYREPVEVVDDVEIKTRVLIGADWSPITVGTYTLASLGSRPRVALNEFNAVSKDEFLGGGAAADSDLGSDTALGRIKGNGGDWFELLVLQDRTDLRGWTIEIRNTEHGVLGVRAALKLTSDDVLGDLRAGTLLTISEDIADDVDYDPAAGDWHINLQSDDEQSGHFISAASQSNFAINETETQIRIIDETGATAAVWTGEGALGEVSVGSDQVLKLRVTPVGVSAIDAASYSAGTSSTWGRSNISDDGASDQDLRVLRVPLGDADCSGEISMHDAVLIAQYSVGTLRSDGACPADIDFEIFASVSDVSRDGNVTVVDALLTAQCSAGMTNNVCPGPN